MPSIQTIIDAAAESLHAAVLRVANQVSMNEHNLIRIRDGLRPGADDREALEEILEALAGWRIASEGACGAIVQSRAMGTVEITDAGRAALDEPLSCPFCGTAPAIKLDSEYLFSNEGRVIFCPSDECHAAPRVHGRAECEAIERWNRRAES